jgi:hypothetical protein
VMLMERRPVLVEKGAGRRHVAGGPDFALPKGTAKIAAPRP